MMKNYYRRYLMMGILFFLISIGLIMLNLSSPKEGYYWILYNKVYFNILYLPWFLYGMFTLVSDCFIPECVIRYESKKRLQEQMVKRLLLYSMHGAVFFVIMNLCLTAWLKDGIWKIIGSKWIFYVLGFLFQWTGWFLIGLLFFVIYLICRHLAATWGAVMVIFILLTSYMDHISNISRNFFSPYHVMYQFMMIKQREDLILIFLTLMGEIACLIYMMYRILFRMDLLARKEGA